MPVRFNQYVLASVNQSGESADSGSAAPYFSPDGQALLFESYATNLAPGHVSQGEDVFLRDLASGEVVQVSTNKQGEGGNAFSVIAADGQWGSPFSPDGTKVLFWSLASNLVAGDRNFRMDLFMKDMTSGDVTLVSVAADGRQGVSSGLSGASFTADGGSVIFETGDAFASDDLNGGSDIYLKNLATGALTRLSTRSDGSESDGEAHGAILSPDGTKLLFSSDAADLVDGDINGRRDVFLKDLRTGVVTLVSRTATGGSANADSIGLDFSPDGSHILFTSLASNVVARDTNGVYDLFGYDIASGRVQRMSVDGLGRQLADSTPEGRFTPDGRGLVFKSGINQSYDLFYKDLRTGEVTLVTRGVGGDPATGFMDGFSLSPDGRHVAVATDADNIVAEAPPTSQIYVGPLLPELPRVLGTAAADRLIGTVAAEAMFGRDGNDLLTARGGSDRLDGGAGADRMEGGGGHDVYFVDHRSDRPIEVFRGGLDSVVSRVTFILGAHVERLELAGAASINGAGNGLANEIVGNNGVNVLTGAGGNDILDGRGGADRMIGGAGNDHYYVERGRDAVVEGQSAGLDTVSSTVSLSLAANVERLELVGGGRLAGNGNGLANVIVGNDAANVLDGRGGADQMVGRFGNDVYRVDSSRDRVVEEFGAGIDLVRSSANWVMGHNVEDLVLIGSARNGTGNVLDNRITGNSAGNSLSGGEGEDVLLGGGGVDRVNGGLGDDLLTGGFGADLFYFDQDPAAGGGVDRITDFQPRLDKIGLDRGVFEAIAATGRLSREAFAEGTAAEADDRIVYQKATGRIFYDEDGSGSALPTLVAQVTGGLQLTFADFVVLGG